MSIIGRPLRLTNAPQNHVPHTTVYTVDVPETQGEIVYGQFGVQHKGGGHTDAGQRPTNWPPPKIVQPDLPALNRMRAWFGLPNGPQHLDCAVYDDPQGHRNWLFLAYWTEPERYEAWAAHPEIAQFWTEPGISESVGWFREVLRVSPDRAETIQQVYREHGGMSRFFKPEKTDVHEYFGSMRDRIPASEHDALESPLGWQVAQPRILSTGGRHVRVQAPHNLCHIRSGEDMVMAGEAQMATFLNRIEPPLRAGMDYVRDNPVEVGAYTTRYLREVTLAGDPLEKTCVSGFWQSLEHLATWARDHPSHLAIFDVFIQVLKELPDVEMSFWHEVFVLPQGTVTADYVNCDPATGLLPWAEPENANGAEVGAPAY